MRGWDSERVEELSSPAAGSGIGSAIALALALGAAAVAIVNPRPEGSQAVADVRIGRRGGKACFVTAVVSRWEDVDRAVAEAINALLWTKVIAINLTGTFFGCKRALAEMVPAGRGRIIFHRRAHDWMILHNSVMLPSIEKCASTRSRAARPSRPASSGS